MASQASGQKVSNGLKSVEFFARVRFLLALWDLGVTDIKKGEVLKRTKKTGEKSTDYDPIILQLEKDGAIVQALAQADFILSSGGVSVGDYDYVEQILTELGATLHIRAVAIKPGKPLTVATFAGVEEHPSPSTLYPSPSTLHPSPSTLHPLPQTKSQGQGTKDKGQIQASTLYPLPSTPHPTPNTPHPTPNTQLYFGLPGNPVSALVTFWRFVQPALRKLAGLTDGSQPRFVQAVTLDELRSDGKRETYLWGQLILVDGSYQFRLAGGSHSSGNLINLAQTNALAVIPVGQTKLSAGSFVQILLI